MARAAAAHRGALRRDIVSVRAGKVRRTFGLVLQVPNPVERCPGASFRETHFSGVEDRLSSPYVETAPVRRRQAWKSLGEPKSASNDRKKN
jgi:hypothetical protein